jgi:hypothetical protein
MQARGKVVQIPIVGKYPVAAPLLAHKRVAVFQRDATLGQSPYGWAITLAAFDR